MADTNHVRALGEFFGTLSVGVTALETSFQSALFSDTSGSTVLPTIGTNDPAIRMVLVDDVTRVWEVVYVVTHAAGASTATVVRGRENTTAMAWPAGTVIRCAPVPRDSVLPLSAADIGNLVSPHTGMAVVDTDTGRVRERSRSQGFNSPVQTHMTLQTVSQARLAGPAPTADKVPITVYGHIDQATIGSAVSGTYLTNRPTSCVFFDLPPMPSGILISTFTTRSAALSSSSFARADYWGLEITGNPAVNWRVWFICHDASGAPLANGIRCLFSVGIVGA